MKIKNKTLAMPSAPAAIPPKPKIPAIIATIRNIMVHFNIIDNFIGSYAKVSKIKWRMNDINIV